MKKFNMIMLVLGMSIITGISASTDAEKNGAPASSSGKSPTFFETIVKAIGDNGEKVARGIIEGGVSAYQKIEDMKVQRERAAAQKFELLSENIKNLKNLQNSPSLFPSRNYSCRIYFSNLLGDMSSDWKSFFSLQEIADELTKQEGLLKIEKEKYEQALKQIAADATTQREMLQKASETALKIAQDKMTESKDIEIATNQAAVTAHFNAQTAQANYQRLLAHITEHKERYALLALGVVGGAFLAKDLSKVVANYIASKLGKPVLVRESSQANWFTRLKSHFFKQQDTSRIDEVKLAPDLQERLMEVANATKLAYAHSSPLMNVLFYGPPGTGKTMFAKRLAIYSGLDYAVMSGADFSQFTEGEDIEELHKLFDWAYNSDKGLLVFIDEADSFLMDRSKSSNRNRNLTNAFLSRVEKQTNNKVMFVFATNHPQVLDSAVYSRIGDRVEFKLPAYEQRSDIFDLYTTQYISTQTLSLDGSVTDQHAQIIKALDGFSGREIEGIVASIVRRAHIREVDIITADMVLQVIREKKDEYAKQRTIQGK